MEFLLPVLPVVGFSSVLFLVMIAMWIVTKLCKVELKFPYGRVSVAIIAFTILFSVFKLVTSPITRPVMTDVKNDTYQYQVDPEAKLEAPTLESKSFTPEKVDTTTLEREDEIKSHSNVKH